MNTIVYTYYPANDEGGLGNNRHTNPRYITKENTIIITTPVIQTITTKEIIPTETVSLISSNSTYITRTCIK
jgi:hypothetical protein